MNESFTSPDAMKGSFMTFPRHPAGPRGGCDFAGAPRAVPAAALARHRSARTRRGQCPPAVLARRCPPAVLARRCPPAVLARRCPPAVLARRCPPAVLARRCPPAVPARRCPPALPDPGCHERVVHLAGRDERVVHDVPAAPAGSRGGCDFAGARSAAPAPWEGARRPHRSAHPPRGPSPFQPIAAPRQNPAAPRVVHMGVNPVDNSVDRRTTPICGRITPCRSPCWARPGEPAFT